MKPGGTDRAAQGPGAAATPPHPPRVVFVTGPAGAGKSTLAAVLAKRLGAGFLEGDAFHPPQNRAAMAAGQPLSDAMRAPWLAALGAAAAAERGAGRSVVAACSALKRSHRAALRALAGPCTFLQLAAPPPVLAARLAQRRGHFFPPALLDSQLAALQPPGPQEPDVTVLDATLPPARLLGAALAAL